MVPKLLEKFQKKRKQSLRSLWRRHVFIRSMHPKLESLLIETSFRNGIYFIGCGDEVVYIGQTNSFERLTIESLGRIYHRIADTSLPWSLGLADCHRDFNELESTAIRNLAPKFDTSVPAKTKPQGEEPQIEVVVPIFADQGDDHGGAFLPENLKEQSKRAEQNPKPPWMQGHSTRRSSEEVAEEALQKAIEKYGPPKKLVWDAETKRELMREKGVRDGEPLRFDVNLIESGDVVTIDGEYLGTWDIDENGFVYFKADGEDKETLMDVFVGSLCRKINEWYLDR